MTFEDSKKNISEKLSPQRKLLYCRSLNEINILKEYMFDIYCIEKIYVLEEFYSDDSLYFDKVPILIDTSYSNACKIIDTHFLENFQKMNFYIKTFNGTFNINKDNIKLIKEELHYDKKYML